VSALPPGTTRKDWHLIVAIIGVIVAIIGIVVGVVVSYKTSASNGSSSRSAASPLRFDPVNGPVDRCASFSGTGSAPDGKYLWIVVDSPPPDDKFYFQDTSVNKPRAGYWKAENATVGGDDPSEAGQPYRIGIVTVTPELHAAINRGDYRDGVTELPDGSHDEDVWMDVTAGDERTPC